MNINLLGILKESIERVPFNVYALGIVGMVAAASLAIIAVGGNWLLALAGGIAMFVGMVVLRTIAEPQPPAPIGGHHSRLALALTYTCTLAFVAVVFTLLGRL